MATDLQVVFPQELIQLSSVRALPGVSPRVFDIIGADFSSVDEVLINELPSPEVVVLSRVRLWAQVPDIVGSNSIQSVAVVAAKQAPDSDSLLRFRLGKTTRKVSGMQRLVQLFLKILFTRPGSDIFAQRVGGDALRNLGLNFGKNQGGTVVSDFIVAVGTTARQVIATQSRDPAIPLSERLLSARVTSANFDRPQAALIVAVELTSQAGRSTVANVVV